MTWPDAAALVGGGWALAWFLRSLNFHGHIEVPPLEPLPRYTETRKVKPDDLKRGPEHV